MFLFVFSPLPEPRWYKNEKPLTGKDPNYRMPNFGKSLEIVNVTDKSAGKYTCRFKDQRQISRDISVRVEGYCFAYFVVVALYH